jgi:hypothetical protein
MGLQLLKLRILIKKSGLKFKLNKYKNTTGKNLYYGAYYFITKVLHFFNFKIQNWLINHLFWK